MLQQKREKGGKGIDGLRRIAFFCHAYHRWHKEEEEEGERKSNYTAAFRLTGSGVYSTVHCPRLAWLLRSTVVAGKIIIAATRYTQREGEGGAVSHWLGLFFCLARWLALGPSSVCRV